jgi:hypothetical protein
MIVSFILKNFEMFELESQLELLKLESATENILQFIFETMEPIPLQKLKAPIFSKMEESIYSQILVCFGVFMHTLSGPKAYNSMTSTLFACFFIGNQTVQDLVLNMILLISSQSTSFTQHMAHHLIQILESIPASSDTAKRIANLLAHLPSSFTLHSTPSWAIVEPKDSITDEQLIRRFQLWGVLSPLFISRDKAILQYHLEMSYKAW